MRTLENDICQKAIKVIKSCGGTNHIPMTRRYTMLAMRQIEDAMLRDILRKNFNQKLGELCQW